MSFEPPAGILDIGTATLRVGKLEVAETTGLNQGLQNIVKNDLLVTENNESSPYTTDQKWGLKLPTAWVGEFEVKGQTGKYVEFNFYNGGSTSNAQGYTLNFKDTSLTLKYDNEPEAGLATATIPTIVGTFRKVNIFFERGVIAVSIDGIRYLYHKESDGFNNGLGVASRVVSATSDAFVNLFFESDHSGNSQFKNLRIVNGRFISDKTSNVSFIGSLGVGVNSPQESLDIRGNMHLNRVSNVSQVSVDSNVVTEYTGPHARSLKKYPEIKFDINKATASSNSYTQDGYEISSSSRYSATYDILSAFNGTYLSDHFASNAAPCYSSSHPFNYQLFTNNVTDKDNIQYTGEEIKLKIPRKIKLAKIEIYSYQGNSGRKAANGHIFGSNTGTNGSWTKLADFTGVNAGTSEYACIPVSTTEYYQWYSLVVTHLNGNEGLLNIYELEYYGYEEGDSSLDTTLKTVYNVPVTTDTQLDVYYDAKDLTTMPSPVTDLSPNSRNGSVTGVTLDSTDGINSFKFNGTSHYITSTHGLTVPGQPIHSQSIWFKTSESTGNYQYLSVIGTTSAIAQAGLALGTDGRTLIGTYFGGDRNIAQITPNVWYHAVLVYTGTTTEAGKYYINGKEVKTAPTGSDLISTPTITGTTLKLGANTANGQLFKGCIANFRLYSKALNADQVKELYDYQKDYFLGSKSQLTLYKGHLGVGVTEPSGQFELAAGEKLQEYPPRGMMGYETYMEGHGTFRVLESSSFTVSATEDYLGWEAFDKNLNTIVYMIGDSYDGTSGNYTGSNRLAPETPSGAYLVLEMPYKIYPKQVLQYARSNNANKVNKAIYYGKADPGDPWTVIHNQNTPAPSASEPYRGIINSDVAYQYLAIVVTNGATVIAISNLAFYGTPGPTTLDKGSLTLGRSLDVPRVSRYDVDTETPRPEKLVVDFDTTVNSSPTDISGKGNHGVFSNASGVPTYSAADKAFDFDGVNGAIYSGPLSPAMTGDKICSMSAWFKTTNASTVNQQIVWLGAYSVAGLLSVAVSNGTLRISIGSGCSLDVAGVIESNTWYHVVGIKQGTGSITSSNFSSTFKLYLNGEPMTGTFGGTARTLNVTTNYWYVGAGNSTGAEAFPGYISNPKLYDTVLEPSEVRKLYNLGRTGRSMVISDTAVGIGRAPEAQLDVRGTLAVRGRVGVGTSSPNAELHVVGASGQLTSAQHYGFASGGPVSNYGVGIHNTVSIYGNDDIVAGGYVLSHAGTMASSDERIKKEIVDVEDGKALSTLRLLKPKQYKYRDDVKRGTESVWGFIAQEVSATLPYATQLRRETVPNIYELANVSDSNVITFTNFDTSTLESNVFNIKVFDTENNEHTVNLTEVINERSIRVNKDLSNWTANVMTGNQIFVYGQQVDDFTFLKKDAIWTVATAALQEVDRQLQNEKIRNDTLETQVSDLLERVAALENA